MAYSLDVELLMGHRLKGLVDTCSAQSGDTIADTSGGRAAPAACGSSRWEHPPGAEARFGSEHPVDVLGAARACLCASILSRELHISSMWSGRSSRGLVRRLGGWFGDWGAVSASLGPGDPSHRASMSLGTIGCRGFDVWR